MAVDDSKNTGVQGSASSQARVLQEKRIGNFDVERLIGEGAMGSVYLGVHPTLHRKVAIKVLRPELASDANLVERFAIEARAASGLGHVGLVEVLDFGTTERGRHYQVMEFLEGQDLEGVIAQGGAMQAARAARLMAQAAEALSVAHANGIVHRDLKPANLFVTTSADGQEQIKVLDFGIAKLLGSEEDGKRTQAGMMLGTPMYASPEQALGQPIDGRSDIYSLGVVLFELLSGSPPFAGGPLELLNAHASVEPPNLTASAPHVSPSLVATVMRCLQKDVAARPQSMQRLSAALRSEFDSSVPPDTLAGMSTMAAPVVARSGRGWPGALVAAVVIAAASFAGYMFWRAPSLRHTSSTEKAQPTHDVTLGSQPTTDATLHAEPESSRKSPFAVSNADAVATGAAIFTSHCVRCHGVRGEGDGSETPPGLEPKSFADANTLPGALDRYRFEIIRRGVHSEGRTTMPAFQTKLSSDETWQLVTFLGTLAAAPIEDLAKKLVALPKPESLRPLLARGKRLFRKKCSSCHGTRGRGDGRAREFLGRPPADLTRGVFKLRSTPKDALPTDEDLFRTVSAGMGVGGMPGFSRLDALDRWALVAHVKSLSSRFKRRPADVDILVVPPAPAAPSALRGKELFSLAGCIKCHGTAGMGDGPKASQLKDHLGRKITVPNFQSAYRFIGGGQPEDIYRTMMTGISGTPMPSGNDFFDEKEAWDVVTYIRSLRK